MLQITKVLLSDSVAKDRMEQSAHQNAFEYLPPAKQHTYAEITGNRPAVILILRLQRNRENDDAAENSIIQTGMFMRVFSEVNHVFADESDYELKSICHQRGSAENDENTMVVYACIVPENENDL